MDTDIWHKCINCPVNCCKIKTISHDLFLTKYEEEMFIGINDCFPCIFLDSNSSCKIHHKRPIDCRLFPFDIASINNKLFWTYWKTDCLITKNGTMQDFEYCLKNIEKKIMPKFKKYAIAYSQHRLSEFINNYGIYAILREIK